jgi:hypothetical protein
MNAPQEKSEFFFQILKLKVRFQRKNVKMNFEIGNFFPSSEICIFTSTHTSSREIVFFLLRK